MVWSRLKKSHTLGLDHIKTLAISQKAFDDVNAPSDRVGMAIADGNNRQIYVRPNPATAAKNQEFRWEVISVIVFAELLHHAKGDGLFTDKNIDQAALLACPHFEYHLAG
jgi:hypothetical protein